MIAPRTAAILLALAALTVDASAQGTAGPPPLRRLEISGGIGLLGGTSFGEAAAAIRANSTTPTPYRLFTTDSSVGQAAMFEVRVGTSVTRRFGVEGRLTMSRPELRSSIAADVEGAPGLTVTERIDQYVIDGAVIVLFDEASVGGLVPFASAGAGYLRQLHEGVAIADAGRAYHVGGGVKHVFFSRVRGGARAAGVRADARVYFLTGGLELDDGTRPHLGLTGSFFVTF
jgi:hypothetical protein